MNNRIFQALDHCYFGCDMSLQTLCDGVVVNGFSAPVCILQMVLHMQVNCVLMPCFYVIISKHFKNQTMPQFKEKVTDLCFNFIWEPSGKTAWKI